MMERESKASSSQSKNEVERVLRDPSLKNISLAKGLELVIPSRVNYIENSEILKFICQKPSHQSTSHGLEKGAEANLQSSSSHLTRNTGSGGPSRTRDVARRRRYNRKDRSSWSGNVAPYPYYTPSRLMSSQVMIPSTPQHGINFIVGSTQAGTTWISQQQQQNTYNSFAGANQSYPNFNNFCPPTHLNQFATPIAAGQYGVNAESLFNEWKRMSMIYQQSMYAAQHGINPIGNTVQADANMISQQRQQGNTNMYPAGFHQSLSNFNNFCTQGNPAYLNQSTMPLAAEQNMQSIAAQYGGEQLQQPVTYGIPPTQQNVINGTNTQSIAVQYGGEKLQQPVAYGIPPTQQNVINGTNTQSIAAQYGGEQLQQPVAYGIPPTQQNVNGTNMQSIAAQYGGEQLHQPVAYGIPPTQQNVNNGTDDTNMQGMIVPQHEQENTQQTLVGAHQFPTNSNNMYTPADPTHMNQIATPVPRENGILIENQRSENVPLAQEINKEVINVHEQEIQNLADQASEKLEGRMEGTGEVLPVSSAGIETACLNEDDELDAILREWETIGS